MKLNKEFAQAAKAAGVCREWYERLLQTEGPEGLADMFFNGIDFCLSKGVPSLQKLRELGAEFLNPHGLYIDQKGIALGNVPRAAFFGACEGSAAYNGMAVAQLYATGDTQLHVIGIHKAAITVDAFDNSRVTVEARDGARITVFQYEGAHVETITGENAGTVKVVVKHKKTY